MYYVLSIHKNSVHGVADTMISHSLLPVHCYLLSGISSQIYFNTTVAMTLSGMGEVTGSKISYTVLTIRALPGVGRNDRMEEKNEKDITVDYRRDYRFRGKR